MLTLDNAHVYHWGDTIVPGVNEINRDAGLLTDAQWYTESGRQRGEYVHETLALYDEGQLEETTLDARLAPYLMAWRNLLRMTGIQIEMIEQIMYHQELGYAGKPDRIITLRDQFGVLEIKTGVPKPSDQVQVAAYSLFGPYDYGWVAYLRKDGEPFLRSVMPLSEFRTVFLACLTIYRYKHNRHRRIS